jgi:hypothetical protein
MTPRRNCMTLKRSHFSRLRKLTRQRKRTFELRHLSSAHVFFPYFVIAQPEQQRAR